jgi:cell shape-determining protein MreC
MILKYVEFMPMYIIRWVDHNVGLVIILMPSLSILSLRVVFLIWRKVIVIISLFIEVAAQNSLPTQQKKP